MARYAVSITLAFVSLVLAIVGVRDVDIGYLAIFLAVVTALAFLFTVYIGQIVSNVRQTRKSIREEKAARNSAGDNA